MMRPILAVFAATATLAAILVGAALVGLVFYLMPWWALLIVILVFPWWCLYNLFSRHR